MGGDYEGNLNYLLDIYNLILVTRNEEDFQASKLSIINPWNDEEKNCYD